MGIHFQRGQMLFTMKRYREAAEAYRQELAENPQQAIVYALLGAALVNSRQIRQAEQAVARAIELDPQLAYAYYILSYVQRNRQRLADAERAIVESIRLDQTPDAFHQLAVIADQRGKQETALDATARALQIYPHHIESLLLRGKLLGRQGRFDEAHALLSHALSHNPNSAAAHHAYGSLQLRSGDAAVAIDALREARRLDPIGSNDAAAIALAYGRLIQPLRMIDPFILRWPHYSAKKRCVMFALLALFLVIAPGGLSQRRPLEKIEPSLPWAVTCIAIANYLALSYSFENFAQTVGFLALRREFRTKWVTFLARPLGFAPPVAAHFLATIAGGALSIPPLALLICLFCATTPLLFASIRGGARRLIGWICLPLWFFNFCVAAIGIATFEESPPGGLFVVTIAFTFAYFSDNIVRRFDARPSVKLVRTVSSR